MSQSQVPAVSRVQEVFEQVLAQPEFRERGTSPLFEFLGAIANTIERFLARWLPSIGEEQVRLVSWFLLASAVCAGVYVTWRWLSDRTPGARRPPRTVSAPPALRDAAAWAQWARAEALAGRLREAATGLYQAVLLHLEAQGTLRYGDWKTPGDYASEVSPDPRLRVPFRSFLGHFVALAFGPVEPTHEELESLFVRAERLGCPI
jgi:hypothetical protein